MAESVQIKIDTTELEISEKKLADLYKSIANRRVKILFVHTKGAVADELLEAAQQLNDIGAALTCLIKKTETAVMNTRISFTSTDNMISQWFVESKE